MVKSLKAQKSLFRNNSNNQGKENNAKFFYKLLRYCQILKKYRNALRQGIRHVSLMQVLMHRTPVNEKTGTDQTLRFDADVSTCSG